MNSFSSRLKKIRKEKNLTQLNLANDLGYSRSTIANYEQETRLPSSDVLIRIADYFNVSIDYLLGRSNINLRLKKYFPQNHPTILLFIDPETGKIIEYSPFTLSFYGYSRTELLNKTIFDLNTFPKNEIKILMNKAKEKKQQIFHFKQKQVNGEIKDCKIITTSLVINNKIIIAFLIHDITSFKRNENIFNETLDSLLTTLSEINQYKTPYKKYHSKNVTHLAHKIGKELGLPTQKLKSLKIASLLHDIGELHIPDDILNKPGLLTENEYKLVKDHPEYSYKIIKNISFNQPVAKIILQHHERIDGSGYPNGFTKNNILIEANILAVADVVEALTSNRPYRQAFGIDYALNEIRKNSNIKYDKEVVDVCIKLFKDTPFIFGKI